MGGGSMVIVQRCKSAGGRCKSAKVNEVTEFGGQRTEDAEKGDREPGRRTEGATKPRPTPLHWVGLALRANLACLSIHLGQHAVLTLTHPANQPGSHTA
jgi:hypothetical protein